MDSFETVVASIMQRDGYWTRTSVKVELSPAEKHQIGRYSSPRWELDVVAYRGRDNELRVIECKSLLDSAGVDSRAFTKKDAPTAKHYKLFREPRLRRVVLNALKKQLYDDGFCAKNPKTTLCLAAGNINRDDGTLQKHFDKKGWMLMGPKEIKQKLRQFSEIGYENSIQAVVTKLLVRDVRGGKNEKNPPA